jgi:hypothetical protein
VPSAQGGVSEQGSGAPARPGRSGRPLGQSWRGARPCITPPPSVHGLKGTMRTSEALPRVVSRKARK